MIRFRRAENTHEILEAKQLLYDFYIRRMGWTLPQNTPTGWMIRKVKGYTILDDRYRETSRWYVGKNNGQIEACLRVLYKTPTSPLDIEHYNHTPAFTQFMREHPDCVELNRFGLLHEHDIFYDMLNFWLLILDEAQREQWTIVVGNSLGHAERFVLLEIPQLDDATFKYHESDVNEVNTYAITADQIPRIMVNCQNMLKGLATHP
jgi:hypothetical protein